MKKPWFAASIKRLFGLLLVTMLLGAAATTAHAESARELKDTGLIGERLDGYLGAVQSLSAELQAAMDTVNAQRQAAYAAAAADAARPVSEVELVAGARLRENANPGDWIHNAAGEWIQRP